MLTPARWKPDVWRGLVAMLRDEPNHEPPVAAFDFDDTCIEGDISHLLLEDLDREGPGTLVRDYLAECAVDLRTAYARLTATLVGGRTPDEVRARTERALARGLAEGTLCYRAEIRELMAVMRSRGWSVWVVTASPTCVVQVVAEHFDVPPDRVVGMNAALGADGRFTDEIVEPVTFGSGKLEALVAAAGRPPTFAAGDSVSDRGLLESARHGLLLDRGDDQLLARARERGWWIEELAS